MADTLQLRQQRQNQLVKMNRVESTSIGENINASSNDLGSLKNHSELNIAIDGISEKSVCFWYQKPKNPYLDTCFNRFIYWNIVCHLLSGHFY